MTNLTFIRETLKMSPFWCIYTENEREELLDATLLLWESLAQKPAMTH